MATATTSLARRFGPKGAWARYANMAMGCWLFLSAFLWPHSTNEQAGAWGSGVLIFLFAVWSLMNPTMRFATGLTGAWLAVTTLFVHTISRATAINHVVCGVVVVLLALVPGERVYVTTPGDVPRARRT
ncbi:MAG: SPW repeat protein [Deltaproteobacteria bacterium]|nr:SPW repeat protein [Deltaproteobacteria bacterium]